MYTFDHPLFLWLNFDGGALLDKLMLAISTPAVWSWLYVLILYIVWRGFGWRGVLIFLVAAGGAVALGDMISGIFKHTGLLKNLWPSFPARLRPMHTPELEGLVSNILRQGGQYGTLILSKYPIVSSEVIPLESWDKEARSLGHAVIDLGSLGGFRVEVCSVVD